MQITTIHSFLVKPGKGGVADANLRGTTVPLTGKLYEMLDTVFSNSEQECIYEIIFSPNEADEQQNLCKDLITNHIGKKTIASATNIAERLGTLTDNRSGLGLLFIMLGAAGTRNKIVISRFPADSGILADEDGESLTIKFLERIFMKSSRFYKSAVYSGTSFDNDFWQGRAIDKQMVSSGTMADYWIREFLLSDLATPGLRGSNRVGTAFREAYNDTDSSDVKEEILAGIRLAAPLNGTVLNVDTFLTRLNLGDVSKDLVKSKIPASVRDEQFQLDINEVRRIAAFKSVQLNTGVRITANAREFDELISQEEAPNGKVVFSTEGVIVDERIRQANK